MHIGLAFVHLKILENGKVVGLGTQTEVTYLGFSFSLSASVACWCVVEMQLDGGERRKEGGWFTLV